MDRSAEKRRDGIVVITMILSDVTMESIAVENLRIARTALAGLYPGLRQKTQAASGYAKMKPIKGYHDVRPQYRRPDHRA